MQSLEERMRQLAATAGTQDSSTVQGDTPAPARPLRNQPRINFTEFAARMNNSINSDLELVRRQEAARRNERIPAEVEKWRGKVGERYRAADLTKLDNPVVRDHIIERLTRFERRDGLHSTGLLLYGDNGGGKTWAAHVYACEMVKNGYLRADQIVSLSELDLADISRSGYKQDGYLKELLSPKNRFFFIDEVGRGIFSDVGKRTGLWFQLLDHIMQNEMTIVIATNLPLMRKNPQSGLPGVDEWVGKAALERLKILSQGGVILVGGDKRTEVERNREREYASRYGS